MFRYQTNMSSVKVPIPDIPVRFRSRVVKSLHVQTVMTVTSAKLPGIFFTRAISLSHFETSAEFSRLSNVQRIVSMLWVTPPVEVSRVYSYSKKTSLFESTITPCKS